MKQKNYRNNQLGLLVLLLLVNPGIISSRGASLVIIGSFVIEVLLTIVKFLIAIVILLIPIVVIVLVFFTFYSIINAHNRLEHYDMNKVSMGKMSQDIGKSQSEIRRNLINGKYDKDDKFRI